MGSTALCCPARVRSYRRKNAGITAEYTVTKRASTPGNIIYRGGGGYKEMSSILADQWRPCIWAQTRGRGGSLGSQPMSTAVHRSQIKLWRSNSIFKGTVSRDFLLLVLFMNQFPPRPRVLHYDRFEFFRKFAELKVCHRCQQHRWQMEKIFNQKNFNNFVWSPLGWRKNIYIHFCLQVHFQVSAAWYCSHYLPPVSLTAVVHLDLRISPRIFIKIRNDPNVIIRGLGEGDSWKKPVSKNLVTLSL